MRHSDLRLFVVVMMPFIAVVNISGCSAGYSSDACASATPGQSTDHSAAGCADADASGSANMAAVPVRVPMMVVNRCLS